MVGIRLILLFAFFAIGTIADVRVLAAQATPDDLVASDSNPFADAQALFYNARYDAAAELALDLISENPSDMRGYELRSTALLFQIRRAVGDAADKEKALKLCTFCPEVMASFLQTTSAGQVEARRRLKVNPKDEEALFFLGKLDLNHVWLHLGTLGKKTGWSEYWEARHSLDDVLVQNPRHMRARLARAWIDYIVDTKMSWGTRWILGGGDKKKALAIMREAAGADETFFTNAEARFALWDVQIREKNFPGALVTARELATDFPLNPELTRFIDKYDSTIKP